MKPLDERHRSAAAVLGQGGTMPEAAEAAGVGTRSVQEWLRRREDFRALVDDARSREAGHEPGALATLRDLLKSPDEAVRLRAAIALLNAGRGGRDHAEDDKGTTGAAVLVLDPAFFGGQEDPPPAAIDAASLYADWDGRVSQAEADAHDRGGAAFGDGWEAR